MPIWLTIALQVLEIILKAVLANAPQPGAAQVELDTHSDVVARLNNAMNALK